MARCGGHGTGFAEPNGSISGTNLFKFTCKSECVCTICVARCSQYQPHPRTAALHYKAWNMTAFATHSVSRHVFQHSATFPPSLVVVRYISLPLAIISCCNG
ncbi:Uncharacterized protein Adt_01109 [Abeliophyllum distichum]|uniref:Uncharacterized protein n=1 Tax=Abeliophyllum distichum TaxID=126358 RepID=A0ABD1VRZ8_9LAMI